MPTTHATLESDTSPKPSEGNHLTPTTDTPTGSSLDVQDDNLTPSATASSLEDHDVEVHDLDHDHTGHDHEGHEHHHAPAPTLNPELTRSIEVEASAESGDPTPA